MTTKAAALAIRKGGQKEAISAKKDAHARDLEIGLNATMQKVAFVSWGRCMVQDISVCRFA